MADLIVHFTRYLREAPIMSGDDVRTEVITIGAEAAVSDLEAVGQESVVHLVPGADCWVAVGPSPEASAPDSTEGGEPVWALQSGVAMQLKIEKGMKVSVIQRS